MVLYVEEINKNNIVQIAVMSFKIVYWLCASVHLSRNVLSIILLGCSRYVMKTLLVFRMNDWCQWTLYVRQGWVNYQLYMTVVHPVPLCNKWRSLLFWTHQGWLHLLCAQLATFSIDYLSFRTANCFIQPQSWCHAAEIQIAESQ